MIKTATFDRAPPAGTINFGIGQPSADLLPVDLLRTASEDFFRRAQPQELNYGVPQGDERFLDSLASFLSTGYGQPVAADSLFVTGGNSQALDYLCSLLTRPGDTVFVEEPSYFLAFRIFLDHGLNIVGVPVDVDGLEMDRLEAELEEVKPALLYTIPSFHNPGGQTMSGERRQRLVELSQEHDFLIVADEVYQLLHYYEPPPAALGTAAGDTVLSLGSFSKILAPGLRLGWVQTPPAMMRRLLATGVVNSGGCLNHFASHVVRHAIDLGLQQSHLERLRRAYRSRVEAMDSALREHLSAHATWNRPDGGYFFWLELKEHLDTAELRRRAGDLEVGFQAGELFSSRGGLRNCLRLSFAHYNESEIQKGVARLAPLFRR